MVDQATFAFNLALIIGALLALGLLVITLYSAWTLARVLVSLYRNRRAMREYLQRCRLPDGSPLPPQGMGICEHCGRRGNDIFFPQSGEETCPACFRSSWAAAANDALPARRRGVARLPAFGRHLVQTARLPV